jgi:hypothetical protein
MTVPNSRRACSTLIPFTLLVISEALALEIAQPSPWKAMSSILPSFTTRKTSISSPHNGL